MFIDGLNIMILGMIIVFAFLMIIYLSMTISTALIHKFHLKFNPEPLLVSGEKEDESSSEQELAAVISAAAWYCKN